jgi:hypothetical protein
MFPVFRPARVEGETIVHFRLVEGDERGAGSLAKAFPDRIIGPFGRGINAGVSAPMPSLAAADERRRAAERLPGVERLEVQLIRDFAYSKPFDDYLAKRVASQQAAVASA